MYLKKRRSLPQPLPHPTSKQAHSDTHQRLVCKENYHCQQENTVTTAGTEQHGKQHYKGPPTDEDYETREIDESDEAASLIAAPGLPSSQAVMNASTPGMSRKKNRLSAST